MAGYLASPRGPGRACAYLFAATFAAPDMTGQLRHWKQATKPADQLLAVQLSIMAALVAPAKDRQRLLLQINQRNGPGGDWPGGVWPGGCWPGL